MKKLKNIILSQSEEIKTCGTCGKDGKECKGTEFNFKVCHKWQPKPAEIKSCDNCEKNKPCKLKDKTAFGFCPAWQPKPAQVQQDFLKTYLIKQIDWSKRTFGESPHSEGICKHIEKELAEIRAEPHKLEEWVDVMILALDGAWRAGYSPDTIMGALQYKQEENFQRQWADLRDQDESKPTEHVRKPAQVQEKMCECGHSKDAHNIAVFGEDDCMGYTPATEMYLGVKCSCTKFTPAQPKPAQGVDADPNLCVHGIDIKTVCEECEAISQIYNAQESKEVVEPAQAQQETPCDTCIVINCDIRGRAYGCGKHKDKDMFVTRPAQVVENNVVEKYMDFDDELANVKERLTALEKRDLLPLMKLIIYWANQLANGCQDESLDTLSNINTALTVLEQVKEKE